MIPAIFEVVKTEVHALHYCQCSACVAERARLESVEPSQGIIKLTPQAAFTIGLIPNVNPHGSLARELAASH